MNPDNATELPAGLSPAVALDLQIEVLRLSRETLRSTEPVAWARATVQLASLLVQRSDFRQKAESLEKAIEACRQALPVIPRDDERELWGRCQSLLAIALSDRPAGVRDDNLDEAIAACREALQVFPRETDPENWASMMNILGTAYANRTRGGPSQNREEALAAFEAALQVRTRDAFPQQWAYLQNNLAVLYRERIEGDPAENLERAIAAGTGALEVLDPEEDFAEWVMVANNLASAWRFRVEGDPGDNVDTAIHLYEAVAERLDPKEEPELWADAWQNLAAAWSDQVSGDTAINLENAILAGERSLSARSREASPKAWAQNALVLAAAYAERIEADRTENIEKAIEMTHQALEILDFDRAPLEWASGMMNMAALYLQRQRVRHDVNVEAAILACEQATIIFQRDTLPLDWARTLNILGIAYFSRSRGERLENLKKSLECFLPALEVVDKNRNPSFHVSLLQNLANAYVSVVELLGADRTQVKQVVALYEAALKIRTRETAPYGWARLQHNLGNAWRLLACGRRSLGFRKAETAYGEALTVRTLEGYPDEHRITQSQLGHLYFAARCWKDAERAYAAASAGLERTYEAVFTPDARQAELTGASDIPLSAAYAQARRKRPGVAVETLERSRTRTLTESLAREAVALRIVSAEERAAWSATVARIAELEASARAAGPTYPRPFLEASGALREAYEALADLLERARLQTPDILPRPLDLEEIRSIAAAAGRPLVYLATTRHGSVALPVLPGGPSSQSGDALWLDGFSSSGLSSLLEGSGNYLEASLSADAEQLARVLDRGWPLWCSALMEPLDRWLAERGFREGLLIPCGRLALLPLHAVSEEVLWTVIPSARMLQRIFAGLEAREARPPSLLGVGNPWPSRPPLPCGEIEIDVAGSLFPTAGRLLRGSEATRVAVIAGLPGATHLHFACHGRFYPWVPLESGLELAAGEALTLRDVLDGGLDLSAVRLAVLSACETGFTEYQRTPDEGVSLPTALLHAGVTGVLSSLWSVGDLATLVFVRELYRAHLGEGLEPAQALRQARVRLREGTAASLGVIELCEEWLERSGGRDRNAYRALRHHRAHPDAVPFRHARHWAGFVLNGV